MALAVRKTPTETFTSVSVDWSQAQPSTQVIHSHNAGLSELEQVGDHLFC